MARLPFFWTDMARRPVSGPLTKRELKLSVVCKCGCGQMPPPRRGRGRPREFATDECRVEFNNSIRDRSTGVPPGRRRRGPWIVGGHTCMDCDLPTSRTSSLSYLGFPLEGGELHRVCPDCAELRRTARR